MIKPAGNIRTALWLKNIKIGFWFKVGSQGLNFLMVPILLKMLGSTNYGIWLLITSIAGWSSLFDLGISSGLRNRFAASLASGNFLTAKSYVSSAYFLLVLVISVVLIIASPLIWFLDLGHLLHVKGMESHVLRLVLGIVFVGFSFKLVLNLISTLLTAHQEPYLADGINFSINLLSITGILAISEFAKGSIIEVSLILSGTPVIVLTICSIAFFFSKFRAFKPSFQKISFKDCRDLTAVGARFLSIQVAGIIIFSTDSLIITRLFGPDEVANYFLAFKYFGLVTMGFTIISNPLWSAYTNAYTVRDFSWIRDTTGKLQSVWLLFSMATFVLFLVSNRAYTFWLGEEIEISWLLSASMAFYVTTYTWGSIFVNFINGVGKIKLQVIFSIIAGIVNIPLSVLLAKFTFLGPSGVILATTICLSYGPLVSYYQYQKILNNTATGIWNQ